MSLISFFARITPHRAVYRLAIAAIPAVVAAFFVGRDNSDAVAFLASWNAGGALLMILSWLNFTVCDADATGRRAASDDPGRTLVYAIVVLTSTVSLIAATVLSRRASNLPPAQSDALIALCLCTVALSWALTHTAYAHRYAHLYYREDKEGVGGVEFPGGAAPTYFDFAYFAFTVGMCFQVSDTAVSSAQIRRSVLLHAIISFGYNTVILAFVLNIAFGASR